LQRPAKVAAAATAVIDDSSLVVLSPAIRPDPGGQSERAARQIERITVGDIDSVSAAEYEIGILGRRQNSRPLKYDKD
jgi:hypothetical protein